MEKFNYAAEIDFLNQFAKCEEISNVEWKLKKICKLFGIETGTPVDLSRNIFRPGMLTIEEYCWCQEKLDKFGKNVYDYLGSTDSSLNFGKVKIIFMDDVEFLHSFYIHSQYDHLNDEINEVTLMLVGKSKLEYRSGFVRLFDDIVRILVRDVAKTKYHVNNFYNAEFVRFLIDIYIVRLRLLDSIVDLKFDDKDFVGFTDPKNSMIFDFAIRTDTTPKDYCDLIANYFKGGNENE